MSANSAKMTGKARDVAATVCATTGHKIQSLQLSPAVDRKQFIEKTTLSGSGITTTTREFMSVTLIPQFEQRCVQCGMTPKEIENLRDRPDKKAKAKPEATAEVANAGN